MIFLENISLRKFNTFGIDANARKLCKISSKDDIHKLRKNNEFTNNKYLILGGGSNIMLTKNFDGLIVKNEIIGKIKTHEDEKNTIIKVGAGENWHEFVLWTIKEGLSGVENLALIPGNIGAAPMQNIGAYGVEVKDCISNVWAVNIETGEELIFSNKECNFTYRDSIFKNDLKNKTIITHVSFILNKTPNHNISYGDIKNEIKGEVTTEKICNAVIRIRKRKLPDPNEIGNSGSFFKNPIITLDHFSKLKKSFPNIVGYKVSEKEMKVAAGWMIDKCGWKGYRKGDAGVHKNQALVLVNYGNASGKEILEISKDIQKSVLEKFSINLETEVNII